MPGGTPGPGEVAFLKSLGSVSQARTCYLVQGGDCIPQGTFGYIWKHFWLSQLGKVGGQFATGIYWVETGDAAIYPIMHRTVPHNNESSGLKCQQCLT